MGLQDCGRATGTHERGEGKPPPAREWGLPGLLGTDLGPQLWLLLGGCADSLGCTLGQATQPMLWSSPGPGVGQGSGQLTLWAF